MSDEDSVERLLIHDEGEDDPRMVPLAVFLDWVETRRDSMIMELRDLDKILIRYGRLRTETIPRRQR